MKPATLVTLTGRPAVVTDAVSSPSFGMSRVGRMPATIRPGSWHTRRPLISRGSGRRVAPGKSEAVSRRLPQLRNLASPETRTCHEFATCGLCVHWYATRRRRSARLAGVA